MGGISSAITASKQIAMLFNGLLVVYLAALCVIHLMDWRAICKFNRDRKNFNKSYSRSSHTPPLGISCGRESGKVEGWFVRSSVVTKWIKVVVSLLYSQLGPEHDRVGWSSHNGTLGVSMDQRQQHEMNRLEAVWSDYGRCSSSSTTASYCHCLLSGRPVS